VIIYTHQIYHDICSVKMLFIYIYIYIRLCHCVVVWCIQVLYGSFPFLSLSISSSQFIFFIAAGNTIGLYFDGNVCYTFDSDAQNEYGLGNVFVSVFITLLTCVLKFYIICFILLFVHITQLFSKQICFISNILVEVEIKL
jgi:hypothetical protein